MYFDIRVGDVYLGYWDAQFHYAPAPDHGQKQVIAVDSRGHKVYANIPFDAEYIGFKDDKFNYYTRDQIERLNQQKDDDTAMLVSAVVSGLSTAVQGFQMSQHQLNTMRMQRQIAVDSAKAAKTSPVSSRVKSANSTGGSYLADRKCSRCGTTYVGIHCPACAAPKFNGYDPVRHKYLSEDD